MSPAARIILGLAFGFGTLGFLCAGLGGAGKDSRANALLLGSAAITAVITLYIATTRGPQKAQRRTKRPLTMPSAAAEYEAEAGGTAGPTRPRKTLEVRDFDLASVTPAGWAFGLSGVALMLIASCALGFSFDERAGDGRQARWVIRLIGIGVFAGVMVYFTYGSRWLAKQGYPVFRSVTAPGRKKSVARRPDEPPGLPPRRPPRAS